MPRSESNDYEAAEGMDQLTPEEEDRIAAEIERRIDEDQERKGPSYYADLRATIAAMDRKVGGYDPTTPRLREDEDDQV